LVLVTATTVLGGESAEAQAPIGILKDMSASATSLRDSVVALARAQIGSRYRHGGSTPRAGFDCSGLVQYVMARVSMILPRTARQQASIGVAVERDTSQLRPGDLLTFSARDRGAVSHVGIYVGAGRFVHASSVAGRVIESPLFRPPAPKIKVWTGVRRIPWWSEELAFADPVVTPER
jgi:cell wall-associated NlpC family hydrolase